MAPQPHPDATYPTAPWAMLGCAWAGLFHTSRPLALPAELRPLLGPDRLVLILLRYQEGSLRYDELVAGSLARAGLKVGLFVHDIWVSSLPSVAGGRAIWGLPKLMAAFRWRDDMVEVVDDAGPVATIRFEQPRLVLPPLPLAVNGIGRRASRPLFFPVRLWACLGWAGMRLVTWSAHTPYSLAARPSLSFAARPLRATFHAPQPRQAEAAPLQVRP